MNWSNTKPNPSPGRISPLNFPPNGSPKRVPQMGPPNGSPQWVPIWGTPAPPSEIDDFPGVPLWAPPGIRVRFPPMWYPPWPNRM